MMDRSLAKIQIKISKPELEMEKNRSSKLKDLNLIKLIFAVSDFNSLFV